MSTLATPIKNLKDLENPNRVKVVLDKEGRALYFSRSSIPYFVPSGKEPLYLKHIGVYAYTKGFLDKFIHLPPGNLEASEKLEQLRALEYGYKIAVTVVPKEVPEVDTPEDLEYIKTLKEEEL
jgi:3-deoxy-manno-octulosonate cytidylyltransferase (CMP-KDO synthetase)